MTNDELLELKREAKKHAQLLEAAGLHRSRIFTLINSDLPIITDLLIRAQGDLEKTQNKLSKLSRQYDEVCKTQTWAGRADVIKALKDTGVFPKKWIIKHFAPPGVTNG